LDEELSENIEQASMELINQDKTIVDLQSQVRKLKLEKDSLQRDFDLTQRLTTSRKIPLPNEEN
jgi:hypothetical protein